MDSNESDKYYRDGSEIQFGDDDYHVDRVDEDDYMIITMVRIQCKGSNTKASS
jgi:hypothetical protein